MPCSAAVSLQNSTAPLLFVHNREQLAPLALDRPCGELPPCRLPDCAPAH